MQILEPRTLTVMPADTDKLLLRLPPELKTKLRALADRERRSLTAQIVYLLERDVTEDERQQQGMK